MAATFKEKPNGFVLVAAMIIMSLLLFLAIYVASFTLTENRISNSQLIATQNYYLAESGIAEAIWKIKNDAVWKNNFETNPSWSMDFTRNSALYPNGSYTISIRNSALANGTITVTSRIASGQGISQRVVKTKIYKALGESVLLDNAEFADGNIDISGSVFTVVGGGIHSNLNIILNFWSALTSDREIKARNNINVSWTSTISNPNTSNYPGYIPMPAVSFDSLSDPLSYKNRANHIYTAKQFSDLMWANQNLTLNGITYVTGDIEIKGGQNLTINGALVSDGNIVLGANTSFCCWGTRCPGGSSVTINKISSSTPSGLMAKGRIDLELCLNSLTAKGLIYANDKINILSLPNEINITGGLVARKITMTSLWQGTNLFYDNEVITYGLGQPQFSPIVTIEHWEEEY